jgi:hypothetical protein
MPAVHMTGPLSVCTHACRRRHVVTMRLFCALLLLLPGDTQGIVGPGSTWREVQWTKVRMLTLEYGLQPWYCVHYPAACDSIEW